MIQKARFEPPASRIAARTREVSLDVAGGFHGGVPSQDVPPGFSPMVQNFVPSSTGHITPRSALTRTDTFNFKGPVLGADEAQDVAGNLGGVASTLSQVAMLHPGDTTWSALSYIVAPTGAPDKPLSGTSVDYFNFETVFSSDKERMITVFSANTSQMKFFEFAESSITYSDFTWMQDLDSAYGAKDIASVNNRLVFFNVYSTITRWPTRVLWSARGNPLSYLIADGAGAEDLKDMRGTGQAIVRHRDFLLLFTELEIWRATPTYDDYAFRFDRLMDNVGTPYPRTIVSTPYGVVFMDHDFEVWVTDGSGLVSLGPVGGEGMSRIRKKIADEITSPHRAWATFNHSENRYELYYAITGSPDQFPSRAMFFDFATKTWWPQTFAYGLSAGVDLNDPTYEIGQASYSTFQERRVNVFTSTASTFKFASNATDDVGQAIDARWRSRGLKNASRKAHLKEVWIDYETDSASSGSLWIGSARSNSVFTADTALNFATTNDPLFVPTWTTDNAPAFELRLNDGGRPRIASFFATIQDASKF